MVSFVAWAPNESLDSPTKRCVYEWPNTSTHIKYSLQLMLIQMYNMQSLFFNRFIILLNKFAEHWYTSNCNAKLNSVVCMKQNGSTEVRTTPVTPMQPWGCPPGYIESKVSKWQHLSQRKKLFYNIIRIYSLFTSNNQVKCVHLL